MSDGKWLICDSIMIDKLEEIKDRLKEDIERDKQESKDEESWNTLPYEGVLSHINEIQIECKKSYVKTDWGFFHDWEISPSEHLGKHFPQWKHLYDKSELEKKDKEWEETFGKEISSVRTNLESGYFSKLVQDLEV